MKSMLRIMFVILTLSPIFTFAEEKKAASAVIGTADNFVITQDDVKEFRAFVEKGPQRTTEKEYQKYTILIRLFAEEAKFLGLDKDKPEDISTFSGKMKLSEMYMANIADSYVLKDEVIESYYLAHPDLYKTDSGAVKPLNDDIRKEIREKIFVHKKKRIQDAELERLKQKYHLRVCEGECK